MIKRSTFILLTAFMLIALMIFQLLGDSANLFYKEKDRYSEGEYEKYNIEQKQTEIKNNAGIKKEDFCAAIITERGKNNNSQALIDAFTYLKQSYIILDDIAALASPESGKYDLLIVAFQVTNLSEANTIGAFTNYGVNIIFTIMPAEKVIKSNKDFRKLLGINHYVENTYTMDGVIIFENFLLGGKAIYEKCKQKIPYIETLNSCKTYMVGYLKNQKELQIKNEELPAIMWRNKYQNAFVCVANCNFLREAWGVGIAYALFAEMSGTYVYPVINAQTTCLLNYPNLSGENNDTVARLYGQGTINFMRFSLWPSIVSATKNDKNIMTCFITTRIDRKAHPLSINQNLLTFYIKMINMQNGECAFSGHFSSTEEEFDNFKADIAALSAAYPSLKINAFYCDELDDATCLDILSENGALSNVKTIVKNDGSYRYRYFDKDRKIILLPITSNPVDYNNLSDIKQRSIQTALAASNIGLDFAKVIYPEEAIDNWKNFVIEWSKNSYTFWQPFKEFNKSSVSEADMLTRKFFALECSFEKIDDTHVDIHLNNFSDSAYLILKTQYMAIDSISGGVYTNISDFFYLITASDENISITLKNPLE